MLMHQLISEMSEVQSAIRTNLAGRMTQGRPLLSSGPLGDIKISSHIAQVFLNQSQSVMQSLESRQRQFYTLLLSNRNDEAYLSRMTDTMIAEEAKSQKTSQKSTEQKYYEKSLSLKRSEIEVVSSDLGHG